MRIKFSQAVSGKNPASIGIVSRCNHAELKILGSGSFINSDGSEWYGEKVTLPRGIYQKVYLSLEGLLLFPLTVSFLSWIYQDCLSLIMSLNSLA